MELKTGAMLLLVILSLGCDARRVRMASPAAPVSVHAILLPAAPKEGVFTDRGGGPWGAQCRGH
jgi:hypothetical protein